MTTKRIESTVDALAKTVNVAVADAHDQGNKAAHEAGDVVADAKVAVDKVTKTVAERMGEAVEKAGHRAHKLTDKVVHSAQRVNEGIAQAVKEAASKARDKVKGR